MVVKVAIASDHAAYNIKDRLIEFVKEAGEDYVPVWCGPDSPESVDYPDYAQRVAAMVSRGEADRGVLACGSGIGMSIAANKVAGVRAALCYDHYTAAITREHNDSNIVCVGERTTGIEVIREIVITFLRTDFSTDESHAIRVQKIRDLDKNLR